MQNYFTEPSNNLIFDHYFKFSGILCSPEQNLLKSL